MNTLININNADLTNCISPEFMGKFEHKFKTLINKAKRCGVEIPTYKVVETFSTVDVRTIDNEWGIPHTETTVKDWIRVQVTGPKVNIPGFLFIAKIEHTVSGNIINRNTAEEALAITLPEDIRTADRAVCDHCHTSRKRNETFVLLNKETGEMIRIGRNCLAEYLNVLSPEKLIDLAVECEAPFQGDGCGSGREFYDLKEFLCFVCAQVRFEGWVSRKMIQEDNGWKYNDTTAGCVKNTIFQLSRNPKEVEPKRIPTADDSKNANLILDWWGSLSEEEITKSEFFGNLQVILSPDEDGRVSFDSSKAGSVAALYICWQKATQVREERAARPVSAKYLGQVGDKIVIKGTFDRTWISDGDWGSSTLVSIVMEDGTRAQWWQSGGFEYTSKLGAQVTLKGTVKKLDEYKGDKVTVLTRGKWLD